MYFGVRLTFSLLVVLGLVASDGFRHSLAPGQAVFVKRVIDGDTIRLDGGARVRLIGVDTPEMKDKRPEVRALAQEAAAFVRKSVEGKPVRLEYDQKRRHDRYGRTLAYVYLDDGTFLNAEIIRQGYGFAFTRYPFKYLEEFRKLEREARQTSRGLWNNGTPAVLPRH